MKRRRFVVIMIIWLLAVCAAVFADNTVWNAGRARMSCRDGVSAGEKIYLIEDFEEESVLYRTDAGGQVEEMNSASRIWKGSTFEKLACSGELYGVLSAQHETKDGEETLYRVVSFDGDLKPAQETARLRMKTEGTLTGFQAVEDGFYLTVVQNGGSEAGAYYIGRDELKSPAGSGDGIQDVRLSELTESGGGRMIVQADYGPEGFVLRKDNTEGMENFETPDAVKKAFYGRSLRIGQWAALRKDRLLLYGEILITGFLVVILAFVVFRNRNYSFYVIVSVELLLFVITMSGAVQMARVKDQAAADEEKRFGFCYLQALRRSVGDTEQLSGQDTDFYSGGQYYAVLNQMSGFAGTDDVADLFRDICLVRGEDHRVLVSASGCNGQRFDDMYASDASLLLTDLMGRKQKADREIGIGGERYQLLGIPVPDEIHADYLLIGIVRRESRNGIFSRGKGYLFFAELLFLLGSVVSIALLSRQNRELARLARAMQSVADGGTDISKGSVRGRDMNRLWNSLLEINKSIGRMNYSRYNIFESCYRFAPKNIEKILGKSSITEVQAGDAVSLDGTVAVISSGEPGEAKKNTPEMINEFVSLIEKCQEQSGGFFVSGQWSPAKMKLLFLEDSRDTVGFGVSFMNGFRGNQALRKLGTGILLHYSRYTYGVAGGETQTFPFLISGEIEELERYAEWLRSMQLKLVITGQVKERENPEGTLRYIGYIRLSKMSEEIRLYEVLDACGRRERALKTDTLQKFDRALQEFYEHDFYLARSGFSDVIRENPEDYVARWYVFTCEKYLNLVCPDGDICRLCMDDSASAK